jgi:YhcN/YlaJ family sporulation lipoprotein
LKEEKKMKKAVLLGVIFLIIIGLTMGCTPARRVEPRDNTLRDPQQNNMVPNSPNNMPEVDPNNTNIPRENVPNMDNQNTNTADQAKNKRLAEIAKNVDGVRGATVVTTGETAYVGIDIDKNAENRETERIKERVVNAVKNKENITRVYVSADVDSVERLKEIGRDIAGGRPISGFLNELTEMFRRPMPNTN